MTSRNVFDNDIKELLEHLLQAEKLFGDELPYLTDEYVYVTVKRGVGLFAYSTTKALRQQLNPERSSGDNNKAYGFNIMHSGTNDHYYYHITGRSGKNKDVKRENIQGYITSPYSIFDGYRVDTSMFTDVNLNLCSHKQGFIQEYRPSSKYGAKSYGLIFKPTGQFIKGGFIMNDGSTAKVEGNTNNHRIYLINNAIAEAGGCGNCTSKNTRQAFAKLDGVVEGTKDQTAYSYPMADIEYLVGPLMDKRTGLVYKLLSKDFLNWFGDFKITGERIKEYVDSFKKGGST